MATSKQSPAVAAAITGRGESALRPWTAWDRSDCSGLVGKPVDGPARCELISTRGSSVVIARPSAAGFIATPGPELDVTPSAPAKQAPIAEQMAAISSSAWKVSTPYAL